MSLWATATVAANNAVATPMIAMTFGAQLYDTAVIGLIRVMRNTPAVTIVAAWISADTGVGPSIASGNQKYNGSCALLPQAPRNSNVTNAFLPAVAAESRVCQNEIRKYEQAPTPSHPRNVTSRFSPSTSISIENANRF